MTTIIGLVGGRGVGKTTLAQALIRALNNNAKVIKMADPLKNMLRTFGLSEEEIEGSLKEVPCDKLMGQTPRLAMQTLGTEWGRVCIDPNVWIEAWARAVDGCDSDVVIVDDIRFFNEALAVAKKQGYLVYLGGVAADPHPSEVEMHDLPKQFDMVNLVGQFPRSLDNLPNVVEYVLRHTVNNRSEPPLSGKDYDPFDDEIPF